MIIGATGNNIKNALAMARNFGNLKLKETRETLRSGGEDGLHRVHLEGGHIVEVTVTPHRSATAWLISS